MLKEPERVENEPISLTVKPQAHYQKVAGKGYLRPSSASIAKAVAAKAKKHVSRPRSKLQVASLKNRSVGDELRRTNSSGEHHIQRLNKSGQHQRSPTGPDAEREPALDQR